MPELLDRLARDGELRLAPEVAQLVRRVSPATLGRLLGPARATRPRRGATTTHLGTWLRHEIPVRTFTEWDDADPGFLEVDLVAHCGSSTRDALARLRSKGRCGIGFWGGQCLSLADYVTVMEPADWAPAAGGC